ncbi:MAG: phytanoyl-CoA dioxygenase family protein [Pseudomonadota bacterium]
MTTEPATLIDAATRAAFQRDGAVCLRGAFDPAWLKTLGEGIEADIAAPSPRFARHTKEPDAPAYLEDFWVWNDYPQFRRFVHESPCGELAARLLGAPSANLVMDNWFLREAGSRSRPPFHQDLAYFDFEGTMCVLWLPLEPVNRENGIAFVRGSHLWDKLFMRVRFADGHQQDGPAPNDDGVEVNGRRYHAPPDIAADPGAYDILQWDLDAGDCIFFDMRTLHGGLSETVPTKTVRRFTLRMTAPDGMIRYRGDWAAGERAMFEAEGYRDGDRIAGDFFPQLWPRESSAAAATLSEVEMGAGAAP